MQLEDIQGIVLQKYPMPFGQYFVLRVNQASRARQFIGNLVSDSQALPQITPASWKSNDSSYCLNMGITYKGLEALALPQAALASFAQLAMTGGTSSFVKGAVAQAAEIGDTGTSAPPYWKGGLNQTDDVHIVLALYAVDQQTLATQSNRLELALIETNAFKLLSRHDAALLPDGRIHFGYRDGISEPSIQGLPLPQYPDSQPSVPLGAFVLGYESQWASGQAYQVPQPKELGYNGSFGVFRIMAQDVKGFEEFLESASKQYNIDKELLAAKICGRWRNGLPLALSPDTDTPAQPIPEEQLNNFSYQNVSASVCPFSAHIRRVNPRDTPVTGGGGHMHRIIRRGLPYGPPFNPSTPDDGIERGLIGMFIGVSIEDQFEFIMKDWVNAGGFMGDIMQGEHDVLGGNIADKAGVFRYRDSTGRKKIDGFSGFITTRGAAYCFLPSLTALRYIASLSAEVKTAVPQTEQATS